MPDEWRGDPGDPSGEGDDRLDPRERAVRHFLNELEEARSVGDAAREARAHAGLGLIYADQGKLDSASREFRECLLSARDGGDREGVAWSLLQLGRMHGQSGSLEDGLHFLTESMTEWEALGHSAGLLQAEALAANFRTEAGDYQEALDLLSRSLDRARQLDEPESQWRALRAIADIRAQQGQWTGCADAHAQSIPVLARLGNVREEAIAWVQQASAQFEAAQYVAGLESVRRSTELFRQCEDVRSEANVVMTAAAALAAAGRVTEAIEEFAPALRLMESVGDPAQMARMRLWAAELHAELSRWREAVEHARVAAELFARMGNVGQECRALRVAASVHESMGNMREAAESYRAAVTRYAREGMRHPEAATRGSLGAALLGCGSEDEGLAELERAVLSLRALGDRRDTARFLLTLGAAYEREGRVTRAWECYEECCRTCEELQDAIGRDRALEAITQLRLDAGDLEAAHDVALRRLEAARATASVRLEVAALWAVAEVSRRRDNMAELLTATTRIEHMAGESGDRSTALDAAEARMGSLVVMQRFDEAATEIEAWLRNVAHRKQAEVEHWQCTLALAREQVGDYDRAVEAWQSVLPALRTRGARDPLLAALRGLVKSELARGNSGGAERAARELVDVARDGDAATLHESLLLLSSCLQRQGRRLAAWVSARQARKALK